MDLSHLILLAVVFIVSVIYTERGLRIRELKAGCIRHKHACEALAAELASQVEDMSGKLPTLHGGGRPYARKWLEYGYYRADNERRDEWWGDEQPPESSIMKYDSEEEKTNDS